MLFHDASSFGLALFSHRVLSPQFELIDSQGFCVFQLLDILHLLIVASELLGDQDLHTPAGNTVKDEDTPIKTMSMSRNIYSVCVVCSVTHIVVLDTSFIPRKGSSTSGERRTQGANTIARELGDILLCSSSFATLKRHTDQDLTGHK